MPVTVAEALGRQARDIGRGVVGAFLLGLPLIYTMETWWLGWRLPGWLILVYSLGGLLIISVTIHHVGFHEGRREKDRTWMNEVGDFFELLATSFVAGLIMLALMGIIEWGDDLHTVMRVTLMQVVPLGLGAAITNRALATSNSDGPPEFYKEMAVFALGALFFALPIAPTEEMELIAAHAGPARLVLLAISAVVVTYFALYVVEYRGAAGRTEAASTRWLQVGETFSGYVVAFLLSAAMLGGFGHFLGLSLYEAVQQTVVLSFVASLGGAAARVVV